jgi:hypothetical protein
MTATVNEQFTDDALVALTRELAASPRAKYSWGESSPRPSLADRGIMWASAPEGVQNPLWEIVRHMPAEEAWPGANPEPDGHWANLVGPGMTRAYDAGLDRSSLCARYAWSIPTPGDMTWLAQVLDGRGVVEIGAGSGYWAWQMTQSGIDVVAYDPHAPSPKNRYVKHRLYHPVGDRDHTAVEQHPDRALLLCWPPYEEPVAAQALKAYRGDMLIYIGEGHGGCTADDDFFELLDEGWNEIGESPFHVTFRCIHCSMTAYRRNDSRTAPASEGNLT